MLIHIFEGPLRFIARKYSLRDYSVFWLDDWKMFYNN